MKYLRTSKEQEKYIYELNIWLIDETFIPIKERWKLVSNYKFKYEVSNYGRIRWFHSKKLINFYVSRGYIFVRLLLDNNKQSNVRVHRLVALLFKRKPHQQKIQVHHINRIRYDNRAANLQWATLKENLRCIRTKKKIIKLTLDDIENMYQLSKIITLTKISEKYKIEYSTIQKLLSYMHPNY